MTGRVADGIILQLADPDLIRWFVGQVRDAAAAAGRDPASIQVQAAAAAYIGPRDVGRERTRWFPALVSNHVVDLVNKYPREDLPEELTTYVRDREGYDYHHHAEVGSSNASFVTDDVVDRFCLVGSVADHVARLEALAEAGVDQFNLYLMNGNEEECSTSGAARSSRGAPARGRQGLTRAGRCLPTDGGDARRSRRLRRRRFHAHRVAGLVRVHRCRRRRGQVAREREREERDEPRRQQAQP
jgi:hypothetical protein